MATNATSLKAISMATVTKLYPPPEEIEKKLNTNKTKI
jgi:hypothetical protein